MLTTETGTLLSQIKERVENALTTLENMPITPQIARLAGANVQSYFGCLKRIRIAEEEPGHAEGRAYLFKKTADYRQKSKRILHEADIPSAVQEQAIVLPWKIMGAFLARSERIIITTEADGGDEARVSTDFLSETRHALTESVERAAQYGISIVFLIVTVVSLYQFFAVNALKVPIGWVNVAFLTIAKIAVSGGIGFGVSYLVFKALSSAPAVTRLNSLIGRFAMWQTKRFFTRGDRSEMIRQLLRPQNNTTDFCSVRLVFPTLPDELERMLGTIPEIIVAAKPESVGIIPHFGFLTEIASQRPDFLKPATDSPEFLFYVTEKLHCIILGGIGTLSPEDLAALDYALQPESLMNAL